MKKMLITLVVLISCTKAAAVGDASYWTLDARPGVFRSEYVPFRVRLEITGSDGVLIRDLPRNWAVMSGNDKAGVIFAELNYWPRSKGVSLDQVSLSRLLSCLEIRPGSMFADDESRDKHLRDLGKAVEVRAYIYYFRKFADVKNDRRGIGSGQLLELGDKDLIHLLHDVPVLSE